MHCNSLISASLKNYINCIFWTVDLRTEITGTISVIFTEQKEVASEIQSYISRTCQQYV